MKVIFELRAFCVAQGENPVSLTEIEVAETIQQMLKEWAGVDAEVIVENMEYSN